MKEAMRKIMVRAWAIYRETGCHTRYEFGLCLQMAWKEIRIKEKSIEELRKEYGGYTGGKWTEMHYAQYKEKYNVSGRPTKDYNCITKTIMVLLPSKSIEELSKEIQEILMNSSLAKYVLPETAEKLAKKRSRRLKKNIIDGSRDFELCFSSEIRKERYFLQQTPFEGTLAKIIQILDACGK